MTKKFLNWWLLFVLQSIAICVSVYFGSYDFLLENDSTYISFAIVGIWAVASVLIGWHTYRDEIAKEMFWFTAESCMTLGMIGTVLGFIMMLGDSLQNIDPGNIESMKIAISSMAQGMSTALLTTLAGLIASLFLRIQLINEDSDD
jgi:hypothetical protein